MKVSAVDYIVTKIKEEPVFLIMGVCVFLLSVMGTSVRHVSSAMYVILVLLSFMAIKDWKSIFLSLSKVEKLFLAAFLLYTLSGLLSVYNVDDMHEYIKILERYLRFTLIIPVYFLIVRNRISLLNFLYAGAVLSGPFLLVISVLHYMDNPATPAQGYYHHIIFGQLTMLNVGIMLSMLLTNNFRRLIVVMVCLSMLCGLVTAVLSQARGVWVVLPLYLIIAAYYLLKEKKLSANKIIMFVVITILATAFTPVGDVIKKRSDQAVTDISEFYYKNYNATSVGTRLVLWEIAIDVWQEHPIVGTGPGDFDDEVMAIQDTGLYRAIVAHNSVHNIYLQSLVGSGIVGLAALLLVVIIMPLKIFFGEYFSNKQGKLAGFITVISFAIFGLSESWILRLSITSVFLVYIIVIAAHMRTSRAEVEV